MTQDYSKSGNDPGIIALPLYGAGSDLRNDYNDTNYVQSAVVLDYARTIYLSEIAASLDTLRTRNDAD